MTCDRYKNALLRAAASCDEPDAKLARHLENCSTCRVILRSETDLFSRIDRSLRAQMNQDPPLAFLSRLRLQLSKQTTDRPGSNRVWQAAGAALALLLIVALYPAVNLPLINPRPSGVQEKMETPTIPVAQSAGVTRPALATKDVAVRSRHHSRRSPVQSAVGQEPEILVPPDEQKAFAQFVACVARRDAAAEAVATPAAIKTVNKNAELPQVSSVAIADLQLVRAGQQWIRQSGSSEGSSTN